MSDFATPDSLLDRLPPHSTEAEQGVLACILLDSQRCIPECITALPDGASAFYELKHQTIYKAMLEMTEQRITVDVITLHQWLKGKQQEQDAGGLDYLAPLPDRVAGPSNLKFYLDIVADKYSLRRILRVCSEISADVYENENTVAEFIDRAEAEFFKATRRSTGKIAVQLKPAIHRAIVRMEEYFEGKGKLAGISTGFPDLDRMTCGLRGKQMIVIAGRPSMGKSTLGMNIAESVAVDSGLPVGIFSLEMSEDEWAERLICSRSRINLVNVRQGIFTERDFPKITTAAGKLAAAPVYIDDTAGLTMLEISARARRMVQMYGIKVFVIDYLQLMRSHNKTSNRQQEIGEISRGCKQLAKDLDLPLIVLSQLNRDLEKDKNRKPRMSDLRESGDIEQDADLIGLLYRPNTGEDDNDTEDIIPVNLLIAKQRNGQVGDVQFTFFKRYTRFESMVKIRDEDVPPQTRDPYSD